MSPIGWNEVDPARRRLDDVRGAARFLFALIDAELEVHDARTRAAAEGFVDLLLEKSRLRPEPRALPLRHLQTVRNALDDLLEQHAPMGLCENCDSPAVELTAVDGDDGPVPLCARCARGAE